MRTALYRHFDAADKLLYVGITNHALRRLDQHSERSAWFHRIARIAVEWHPSREAAARAERLAIQREKPAHNVRLVGPAPEPQYVAWGIFHPRSRRFDGWYFEREDAVGVLEFFRDEFPLDRFYLVSRTKDQRPMTGLRPLRSVDSAQWSLAPARAFHGPSLAARLGA